MSDSAHARINTIIAKSMALTPPNQASTVSCVVNIFCEIVIIAATIAPSKDAQSIAIYELAEPIISVKFCPSPVTYKPIKSETIRTIIGTKALTALILTPAFGSRLSP